MRTVLLETRNLSVAEASFLLAIMARKLSTFGLDDILVTTNRSVDNVYSAASGGNATEAKVVRVSFPRDMIEVERKRFLGVLSDDLERVIGSDQFSMVN